MAPQDSPCAWPLPGRRRPLATLWMDGPVAERGVRTVRDTLTARGALDLLGGMLDAQSGQAGVGVRPARLPHGKSVGVSARRGTPPLDEPYPSGHPPARPPPIGRAS